MFNHENGDFPRIFHDFPPGLHHFPVNPLEEKPAAPGPTGTGTVRLRKGAGDTNVAWLKWSGLEWDINILSISIIMIITI